MNYLKDRAAFISCCIISLFACAVCFSQVRENKPAGNLLEGAVDFHIHSSPDVGERSLNDFELADLAERKGFKAVVIKNHASSTSPRAELVNSRRTGKLRVYGGVVLNNSVGGINPDAVEAMYKMSPYGKVVWFPTMDAAFYRAQSDKPGGLTVLQANGTLTSETVEVLQIIARENLVLATGHLSPREILVLVPEAKKLGITRILITHATGNAPSLSIAQMKELATAGAMLELTYFSLISGKNASEASRPAAIDFMVKAIQEVGAPHFVLSSDLGQPTTPTPPDGLNIFAKLLAGKGIGTDALKLMMCNNPAKLLDIE